MLDLSALKASHGLDDAITVGKEYKLDGNDEYTFLVRVPSKYNKAYTNGIAQSVVMKYDDEGNLSVDSNMVEFRDAQQEAFIDHCLVSVNGEPIPDDFLSNFPRAVDELLQKAVADAFAIDSIVEVTTKK